MAYETWPCLLRTNLSDRDTGLDIFLYCGILRRQTDNLSAGNKMLVVSFPNVRLNVHGI